MIYAIGDIHGQFKMLVRLIADISPAKDDTLIFLGDYIDRGPDSYHVIECLVALSGKTDCVFLTGNHEDMLKKFMAAKHQGDKDLFTYNGGLSTLTSYAAHGYNLENGEMPEAHRRFFDGLLDYYKIDDPELFFCHAGIDPDTPFDQQNLYDLIWNRNFHNHYAEHYDGTRVVVFAHTPEREVRNWNNAICIDTAAVFGGKLTAVRMPEREFVQVTQ